MNRSRFTLSIAAVAVSSLLAAGVPALADPPPPVAAAVPKPPPGEPRYVAPSSHAQGAMGGVNFDIATLAKAPLGAWSDYTMSKSGSDKTVKIRYSLVEKTAQKLGLEIDTPTPKGPVLMRFDFAPAADAWKLVGGKMQRGAESMDMPKDQIDATPPMKSGAPPGDFIGAESVTIPAGTFACKHYRSKITDDPKGPMMDMWISDKVAPTGLVKSELSPLGVSMQLATTGVGAQAQTK